MTTGTNPVRILHSAVPPTSASGPGHSTGKLYWTAPGDLTAADGGGGGGGGGVGSADSYTVHVLAIAIRGVNRTLA